MLSPTPTPQPADHNFRKTCWLYTGLAFLLLIIGSYLYIRISWYNLDAPDLPRGEARAQPIIDAIYAYKAQKGTYPASLSYLTYYGYLEKIPKPDWRHEYCYDLKDKDAGFTLAFIPKGEFTGDGWRYYSSILEEWDSTDSGFIAPCDFIEDDKLYWITPESP